MILRFTSKIRLPMHECQPFDSFRNQWVRSLILSYHILILLLGWMLLAIRYWNIVQPRWIKVSNRLTEINGMPNTYFETSNFQENLVSNKLLKKSMLDGSLEENLHICYYQLFLNIRLFLLVPSEQKWYICFRYWIYYTEYRKKLKYTIVEYDRSLRVFGRWVGI